MKKNLNILLATFIGILMFSCGEFDDTNLDPGRPGGDNVPLVAVTPIMQTQTHRNLTSSAGRLAGIVTQQFIGFDAQQVAFTQYDIPEGTLANFWEFGLYTGSMRDCVDMISRSETSGEDISTRGLAKLYLAVNLGLATNLWGDIPYSDAFLGSENLQPTYDTQEEIYSTIQILLDEAINDLANTDYSLQGNLTNLGQSGFIKAAHALKARFYMQLTKRDPNASSKALSEIQMAFSTNEDAPIFSFEANRNGSNPLALFGLDRPNTLIIDPFFANLMTGDPRKNLYMIENSDGDNLFFENGNTDLFWAQFESPSPLISFAELKFLEAEALFRTGGDAESALKSAITANMEFLGVSDADITAYVDAITTVDLTVIITEKYKSLYGSNFIQIWNDYRRTGIPALTPNPNGANGDNPSGIVPRRFLYPDSERLSNESSYNAAIQNQGGHLLDVDIWAFAN